MALDMILSFCRRQNKTMAQLTAEEKGQISHRGKAIEQLQEYLEGDQ